MSEQANDKSHDSAMADILGDGFTPTEEPKEPVVVKAPEKPAETPPAKPEEKKPEQQQQNNNTADEPSPEKIYGAIGKITEGKVNSEESLKELIERANKLAALETQHETLSSEHESLKNKKPFANDYLEKLNNLYKDGAPQEKINLFQKLNNLGDLKSLESLDAKKYELMFKNGLSDTEAELFVKSQYKLDVDLYGPDEVELSKIQLKMDGDASKEFLKGQVASFEVAPTEKAPTNEDKPLTDAEIKILRTERLAKVEPIVQSIEKELPDLFAKINSNGLTGDKALTVDLPIPDEVKAVILEQTKKFAMESGVDLSDPAQVAGLKEFARRSTIVSMFENWIIDASSKREEAVRAEFENPSKIDRGINNPSGKALSPERQAVREIIDL